MELFEIRGLEDTELEGMVFGQFTTAELANEGMKHILPEIAEECSIEKSNLALNTVEADGIVTNVAKSDSKKILFESDEDGFVRGYVRISVTELLFWDAELIVKLMADRLVDDSNMRATLHNVSYKPVSIEDEDIVFYVEGELIVRPVLS